MNKNKQTSRGGQQVVKSNYKPDHKNHKNDVKPSSVNGQPAAKYNNKTEHKNYKNEVKPSPVNMKPFIEKICNVSRIFAQRISNNNIPNEILEFYIDIRLLSSYDDTERMIAFIRLINDLKQIRYRDRVFNVNYSESFVDNKYLNKLIAHERDRLKKQLLSINASLTSHITHLKIRINNLEADQSSYGKKEQLKTAEYELNETISKLEKNVQMSDIVIPDYKLQEYTKLATKEAWKTKKQIFPRNCETVINFLKIFEFSEEELELVSILYSSCVQCYVAEKIIRTGQGDINTCCNMINGRCRIGYHTNPFICIPCLRSSTNYCLNHRLETRPCDNKNYSVSPNNNLISYYELPKVSEIKTEEEIRENEIRIKQLHDEFTTRKNKLKNIEDAKNAKKIQDFKNDIIALEKYRDSDDEDVWITENKNGIINRVHIVFYKWTVNSYLNGRDTILKEYHEANTTKKIDFTLWTKKRADKIIADIVDYSHEDCPYDDEVSAKVLLCESIFTNVDNTIKTENIVSLPKKQKQPREKIFKQRSIPEGYKIISEDDITIVVKMSKEEIKAQKKLQPIKQTIIIDKTENNQIDKSMTVSYYDNIITVKLIGAIHTDKAISYF